MLNALPIHLLHSVLCAATGPTQHKEVELVSFAPESKVIILQKHFAQTNIPPFSTPKIRSLAPNAKKLTVREKIFKTWAEQREQLAHFRLEFKTFIRNHYKWSERRGMRRFFRGERRPQRRQLVRPAAISQLKWNWKISPLPLFENQAWHAWWI